MPFCSGFKLCSPNWFLVITFTPLMLPAQKWKSQKSALDLAHTQHLNFSIRGMRPCFYFCVRCRRAWCKDEPKNRHLFCELREEANLHQRTKPGICEEAFVQKDRMKLRCSFWKCEERKTTNINTPENYNRKMTWAENVITTSVSVSLVLWWFVLSAYLKQLTRFIICFSLFGNYYKKSFSKQTFLWSESTDSVLRSSLFYYSEVTTRSD